MEAPDFMERRSWKLSQSPPEVPISYPSYGESPGRPAPTHAPTLCTPKVGLMNPTSVEHLQSQLLQ